MLYYVTGNMFERSYDVLVNPVNCAGVMGKGLALCFKQRYPENFAAYRQACKEGALKPGRLFIYGASPVIVNFATKDHWRSPSLLSYVADGADDLAAWLKSNAQLRTVAAPKLGCGLGGLNWQEVQPILADALKDSPQDIYIYT